MQIKISSDKNSEGQPPTSRKEYLRLRASLVTSSRSLEPIRILQNKKTVEKEVVEMFQFETIQHTYS